MVSFDIDRVVAKTFVNAVDCRPTMASTNDVAIHNATNDATSLPALTITSRQTGGRGRGRNRWWAADGSLTFSLTIDANAFNLQSSDWPKMSLTIGLSICEAIEQFVANRRIHLKWPNDVYLDRKKVCGVLVETIASRPAVIVIGIGINVNNSFVEAPDELRAFATSMRDIASMQFDLTDVLIVALQQMEQRIQDVAAGSDELTEAWRSKCFLEGRTVSIDLGPRQVSGVCQGIDHDGALMIQSEGGFERFFAGVITQIL